MVLLLNSQFVVALILFCLVTVMEIWSYFSAFCQKLMNVHLKIKQKKYQRNSNLRQSERYFNDSKMTISFSFECPFEIFREKQIFTLLPSFSHFSAVTDSSLGRGSFLLLFCSLQCHSGFLFEVFLQNGIEIQDFYIFGTFLKWTHSRYYSWFRFLEICLGTMGIDNRLFPIVHWNMIILERKWPGGKFQMKKNSKVGRKISRFGKNKWN